MMQTRPSLQTFLCIGLLAGLALPACYALRDNDRRRYACVPEDADDGEGNSGGGQDEVPACADCPLGPEVLYVSQDGLACAAIDFECSSEEVRFDSACGCGCRPPSGSAEDGACPDEDAPDVLYLSGEQKVCEGIDFSCGEGEERFDSPCGCGCRAACPDPGDARVHYLSEDRGVCQRIDFTCPPDCLAFDDRCGCGCIEPQAGVACPDETEALYASTSTTVCARIDLSCRSGEMLFDDACGCGCIPPR